MPLCPVALHSMTKMTVMIMISTMMILLMMVMIMRMRIKVRMNDILTRARSPHLVLFLDKFGIDEDNIEIAHNPYIADAGREDMTVNCL